jgi:hypothetical protein
LNARAKVRSAARAEGTQCSGKKTIFSVLASIF